MVAKQVLRAASGWLELGMPDDALDELSVLEGEESEDRRALELKLSAQMAKEAWQDAAETGLQLCAQVADEPDFFLSAAFCLHETGNTYAALKCLQGGPKSLREFAVYHYNMACYQWTLEEKESAREFLAKAISLDESFIESAKQDKDLVGIEL